MEFKKISGFRESLAEVVESGVYFVGRGVEKVASSAGRLAEYVFLIDCKDIEFMLDRQDPSPSRHYFKNKHTSKN